MSTERKNGKMMNAPTDAYEATTGETTMRRRRKKRRKMEMEMPGAKLKECEKKLSEQCRNAFAGPSQE